MNNRFDENKTIVIGFSLDEKNPNLLNFSSDLAKKLKTTAHLTYVCEPKYRSQVGMGEYLTYDAIRLVELKEMENSLKSLKEYKCEFPPNCTAEVYFGSPSDEIISIAKFKKAPLIICGRKETSYSFVPRGFSVPLSILNESNVPVLVVPESYEETWSNKSLNILLCDDLQESTEEAISYVKNLGQKFEGSTFHHINVVDSTFQQFKEVMGYLKDSLSPNNYMYDKEFDEESYRKQLQVDISKKLDKRYYEKDYKKYPNSNLKYQNKVLFGSVDDVLKDYVNAYNIDLVVFGKHRFLHKKPFGIGKMPFNAMLEINKPILVVPPAV